MNTMMAAGGYPWTIIPVERRADYMAALEAASVGQNISPFSEFLAALVKRAETGEQVPGPGLPSRPPTRGYTSAVPHQRLRGTGCL
jgi:hypothetical protein